MAKRVIRIAPVSLNGEQPVFCTYYDIGRRKTFAILQDETVVENPGRDALIKKVGFSPEQPTHTLEYDDKNPEHKIYAMQTEWWRRHPEVMDMSDTKRHDNFARLRFTFVDIGKQEDKDAQFLENVGKVMDKLMKAGKAGRAKIATFYGVPNASQLSDGKIIVMLADVKSGKLMNPREIWNQQTGQTNMDHFLEEYKGDSAEVQFRTNVKRALAADIINVRQNNPRNSTEFTYYINNEPVAKNEDDLIIYLKEHDDLYQTYVLSKLQTLQSKQKEEADNQLRMNKASMDENETRLYAKSLDIKGWNQLSLKQVQDLIKAYEKKQKKEESEATT